MTPNEQEIVRVIAAKHTQTLQSVVCSLGIAMHTAAHNMARVMAQLNVSGYEFERMLRALEREPKAYGPAHVRYFPPEVRAIVRLGQQAQFAARYDASMAKIRSGRVYIPVEIVDKTSGAVITRINDRRWTESQIADWLRLGFDVCLVKGNDYEYRVAEKTGTIVASP